MTEPEWTDDEDIRRYQTASAFRPNHSVEWAARVTAEEAGGWSWMAHHSWPFFAQAEGWEETEAAAKNAVASQLARWRAWPPSKARDEE